MTTTISAPTGAHWEYEEVKTKGKTESLGLRPLLVWDDVEAVRAKYGDDKVIDILDGTSLRVSYQSIIRRLATQGKSDDEIAQAQLDFTPGKRAVGESTPASRAARAAREASEVVDSDLVTKFLEDIKSGKIGQDDLRSLVS